MIYLKQKQLEQLERLRSENTPHPHDYPYYWFISDPKSKKFGKNVSRIWQFFQGDAPSNDSDYLCQISKESIQNCRRYRADTIF